MREHADEPFTPCVAVSHVLFDRTCRGRVEQLIEAGQRRDIGERGVHADPQARVLAEHTSDIRAAQFEAAVASVGKMQTAYTG